MGERRGGGVGSVVCCPTATYCPHTADLSAALGQSWEGGGGGGSDIRPPKGGEVPDPLHQPLPRRRNPKGRGKPTHHHLLLPHLGLKHLACLATTQRHSVLTQVYHSKLWKELLKGGKQKKGGKHIIHHSSHPIGKLGNGNFGKSVKPPKL